MAKEIISDFLVRLGFDGKQVIKGVAEAEAALQRLKRTKIATMKATKDVELDQAVKATKKRIQAESLVNRMKNQQAVRDAVERRKEQSHLKRLLAAKASLRRSNALNTVDLLTPDQAKNIRSRLSQATTVNQIKDIRAEMGRIVTQNRKVSKEMARQLTLANALKFSMSGIVASLKNLARSWVSVFAIVAGAVAGLKFTQEFQALDASMLAVSENTEKAAENVKYIKDLAQSLPVDITKAGDQFKNMLASGAESIGQEGVQKLFTAVTEYGSALQVDPERMDRGLTAISQMLNKGQVMAFEFLRSCKISLIAGTSTIFA